VGHRGGRGEAWPDENTLEAFERAALEGAPAVELDVRLAGDGVAVVFHDEDLARGTSGARGERVESLSSKELGRVALARGGRIPTLAEALAWARVRGIAVNVELKHEVRSRRELAVRAARLVEGSGVDAIVSSFHPSLVGMTALAAPRVRRALLTHAAQGRSGVLGRWMAVRPYCAALHIEACDATPSLLRAARLRGLAVGVWTVNDAAQATELLARGVGYVITDAPGRLSAALA